MSAVRDCIKLLKRVVRGAAVRRSWWLRYHYDIRCAPREMLSRPGGIDKLMDMLRKELDAKIDLEHYFNTHKQDIVYGGALKHEYNYYYRLRDPSYSDYLVDIYVK